MNAWANLTTKVAAILFVVKGCNDWRRLWKIDDGVDGMGVGVWRI